MIPLSKNPPSRFPQQPIIVTDAPWWVAKVKPRQEKALAFDLLERHIEYYLPLYKKTTRRRDNNKPRKTILCLFPGYLSFHPAPRTERNIFATNRISSLVEVKNQTQFVKQLNQIYHTLDLGIPLEPCPYIENLKPGQPVEVVAGPMRGITGTVVKIQSTQKLILSVDILGKAALTIDASLIKPL